MKRFRLLGLVSWIGVVVALVVFYVALPYAPSISILFFPQRMAHSLKSCGPRTAGVGTNVAQARTARDTSPDVDPAALDELVQGNNAFAFDLYRQVAAEADGNLIFSPYSISQALTMAYAGARGDTAQQMRDTLHLTLPPENLHPAANALDIDLTSRERYYWDGGSTKIFELNIANAIWSQDGYAYLPEFLEVMALNYGAGLRQVDFEHTPEAARVAINRWTCQETEKLIAELVPRGAITSDTRLVLTNAVYFNAKWGNPFHPFETHRDTFFLLDGDQVTVPMMAGANASGYLGENYQAVELAYWGGDLAMLVIVPDEGAFEDVESSLDADTFATIRSIIGDGCTFATMPRFDDNYAFSLKDTLQTMGIEDAFTPGKADFSGMTGGRELLVSDVLHNVRIRVDEEGTKAAAATGVVEILEPNLCAVGEVRVDRPFIYLIYDRTTGSILFLGRVLNPAA